jgi:hypothetical protein
MVKADNVIIGCLGHKGHGKTTTAVLFTFLENFYGTRKHLFSNIRLDLNNFKWLDGRDMVELTNKLNDSIILVDELHEYADSRDSLTFQNKRVSDFFLQSRHTESNVYYTTQYKDQIDKRIQRITDVDIVCENLYYDSDDDGDDDLFEITIKDRRRKRSIPKSFIYYAKPIWTIVNTKDRINPFEYVIKEK